MDEPPVAEVKPVSRWSVRNLKRALLQSERASRRYTLAWLSLGSWRRRVVLVAGAILVGFVSIVFAVSGEFAHVFNQSVLAHSPLLGLIMAPGGFALLAWISRRWFPGSQGSGIPQTIAAVEINDRSLRRRLLSIRIVFGKIFLTLGGLACGASIGREGPSVQIGAAIMHTLWGRRMLGRVASERNLILAGGAAGIAAAFNTPLAGIMFAIEELSRGSTFRANSTTLAAVIFAGLTSLALLGNYTYFGVADVTVGWSTGVLAALICGFAGGIAGGLFSRMTTAAAAGIPGRVGVWARQYPIRFAAACGLVVAVLGLATGGAVYGTGYTETKEALEGGAELSSLFGVAKMLATFVSILSGIPGGLFAPGLATGAGLGTNVADLLPFLPGAAVILLTMVAYLSGMTQAPLTSFIIVMEMTDNHQMLVPLMIASLVASGASRSIAPVPLYHVLSNSFRDQATTRS